jgi:DNA-binding SARP family transcriptional activator
LTVLGGFQARLATGQALSLSSKKTKALLAYLALRPEKACARDHLAGLLWGDTPDEQARKSLRQAVYVLRKVLPSTRPAVVVARGETIALNAEAVDVDAADFERLAGDATPEALERAVALYHGDLLEGLHVDEAPFEQWLTAERERFRELALDVFARLLTHQSMSGQIERAIQTAARLLAFDRSQEVVHRGLMRLYARQGRWGAAVKQYRLCAATLRHEVGSDPEPETRRLYQDILQRRMADPAKIGAPAPRPQLDSPPEPPEAPLIGRERELMRLREALNQTSRGLGQVVAIVGEAGIGKTRVLMELAVEAHTRGARVLLGHSSEDEFAFGPWIDAFRSARKAMDVGGSAGDTTQLDGIVGELEAAGGELTTPAPDHPALFDRVTALLRNLAVRDTVVVMLDDVHWADEASASLIAYVTARVRSSRVLVVLTIRAEELAYAPVLRHVVNELASESHFVSLALGPLTRTDTMQLVQSLLNHADVTAGVDVRLNEQMWRASQGNPFVVVETIRAVQEGRCDLTPAALPLPERVRRVVDRRLDGLRYRGRHLTSVAAVTGREFDTLFGPR